MAQLILLPLISSVDIFIFLTQLTQNSCSFTFRNNCFEKTLHSYNKSQQAALFLNFIW